MSNEWISVEDRLPPNHEKKYHFTEILFWNGKSIYMGYYDPRINGWECHSFTGIRIMDKSVTHWMKLPSSPNE